MTERVRQGRGEKFTEGCDSVEAREVYKRPPGIVHLKDRSPGHLSRGSHLPLVEG